MAQEASPVRLIETGTLKKYDADDLTDPVEVIEIEDGKIISHWKKGDDDGPTELRS